MKDGDGGPELCARCGYDARRLPTATCPECGSDLRVVGTMRHRPTVWWRWLAVYAAVMLPACGLLGWGWSANVNGPIERFADTSGGLRYERIDDGAAVAFGMTGEGRRLMMRMPFNAHDDDARRMATRAEAWPVDPEGPMPHPVVKPLTRPRRTPYLNLTDGAAVESGVKAELIDAGGTVIRRGPLDAGIIAALFAEAGRLPGGEVGGLIDGVESGVIDMARDPLGLANKRDPFAGPEESPGVWQAGGYGYATHRAGRRVHWLAGVLPYAVPAGAFGFGLAVVAGAKLAVRCRSSAN